MGTMLGVVAQTACRGGFQGKNLLAQMFDETFVKHFSLVFKDLSNIFTPNFKENAISSSERLNFPSALRAVFFFI